MPDRPDLIRDLTELGRSLPTPGAARMDGAVLARLDEAERSSSSSTRLRIRALAIGLAIIAGLLATPPVRAEVADWFGFGSVVVREGDPEASPSPMPTSRPTGSPLSLEEAAARVEFAVYEVPGLGRPDGAWVSADDRILTLAWDGNIRLDQSSSLTSTLEKIAPSWRRVSVDGREALWFGESHDVAGLDEGLRPAGPTLLWMVGKTTLRLEGERSLKRALALAESVRRHR